MDIVLTLLRAGLLASDLILAVLVAYLLLLTAAAFFAPRVTPQHGGAPRHRFAFLIPAHNEEQL
ncbi:MAG: glycosyl transferase, partial [Chloroflexia bacterium]|nr:glycosyl transferase [Chloroflexia bacterium]